MQLSSFSVIDNVSICFFSKKYKARKIGNQFNVRQISYLVKVSSASEISLNRMNLDRGILKIKLANLDQSRKDEVIVLFSFKLLFLILRFVARIDLF